MIHRGQLVEKIVRKSGYSLTKLAEKLKISRNTLYNRFNDPHLGYGFIVRVGNIIYYDFTFDFPEIKKEIDLLGEVPIAVPQKEDGAAELWRIEAKYIQLVNKYDRLLDIMLKISQQNDLVSLQDEVMKLKQELVEEKKKIK